MAKVKSKEIIKTIKESEGKNASVNMTFRIHKDLAEDFKKLCNKQGVTANSVIIELMKNFIGDLDK